jgi:hypothetical protein
MISLAILFNDRLLALRLRAISAVSRPFLSFSRSRVDGMGAEVLDLAQVACR